MRVLGFFGGKNTHRVTVYFKFVATFEEDCFLFQNKTSHTAYNPDNLSEKYISKITQLRVMVDSL